MTSELFNDNKRSTRKQAGKIGATGGALIAAVYAYVQGVSFSEWDWSHLYSVGLIVFGWVAARFGLPDDDGIEEVG